VTLLRKHGTIRYLGNLHAQQIMERIGVVVLCTKLSITKLPLAIIRIFIGYDYIEGVEPQGLRRCYYQAFRD
jgi:hypothetical protein